VDKEKADLKLPYTSFSYLYYMWRFTSRTLVRLRGVVFVHRDNSTV